jgi:hypothetical protein
MILEMSIKKRVKKAVVPRERTDVHCKPQFPEEDSSRSQRGSRVGGWSQLPARPVGCFAQLTPDPFTRFARDPITPPLLKIPKLGKFNKHALPFTEEN